MSGHQNGQLILWDLRGPNQEMCSLQSRALPVVGCHMLDDNCVVSFFGMKQIPKKDSREVKGERGSVM